MPTLVTTGVDVPAAFPATSYNDIHNHLTAAHAGGQTYANYSGGWSARSYRYVEMLECAERFADYLDVDGPAPPPPERYRQERVLFDFFGAAISCFEASAFANFAMASLGHGAQFPLATAAHERNVSPANLVTRLQAHFQGDQVTTEWINLLQDARYRELHQARNMLTHRTTVSRHHHVGGPAHGTAVWGLTGETIDRDMLLDRASYVTDLLAQHVPAIEQFAFTHC